ncbi:hypothetical protein IV203_032712 [Nitzschia inconspicua]|uniref:Uncharacterized protein n=1 Tax=Nitzschia inconspicua TaxID=303405 RepID=A0A9K3KKV0_9STRA|nr:hypothetical protein IV203_032712 [Nitzschia inconspicua]
MPTVQYSTFKSNLLMATAAIAATAIAIAIAITATAVAVAIAITAIAVAIAIRYFHYNRRCDSAAIAVACCCTPHIDFVTPIRPPLRFARLYTSQIDSTIAIRWPWPTKVTSWMKSILLFLI